MSVEEVLKEATIEFQEPLTLEETGDLLDYIRDNLPARISSRTETHEERFQDYESGKPTKVRGTIRIAGMISDSKKPMAFGGFETIPHPTNTSKIAAIRFPPIPGYSLEEHNPTTRGLWKEVRQQVSNYFSQKQY